MPDPRIRFLVGGVQKCGTTALASALSAHPGLVLPRGKEAHVFDAPEFGDAWGVDDIDARFAPHFDAGDSRLHGDATPLCIYHPGVVARIARYNPAMRWIVLLRDPVERAISHYFMERARGTEPLTLLRAVLAEPRRLRGTMSDFSVGAAWRWASYVDRGRYCRQLDVLLRHFPRDQVLVLRTTDLADRPGETLRRVFEFLGVAAPAGTAGERRFQGDYRAPGALSPARLLLCWRLRGELRELRRRHGVDLRCPRDPGPSSRSDSRRD